MILEGNTFICGGLTVEFIFSKSWKLEVQGQGAGHFGSSGPLSLAIFLLPLHVVACIHICTPGISSSSCKVIRMLD